MCATIIRQGFRVTSNNTELPKGSRFNAKHTPIRDGQLALFQIGRFLIIGRMFKRWIVQPTRWIDCKGADVRALGPVGN